MAYHLQPTAVSSINIFLPQAIGGHDRPARRGFTLVEVLVAVALGTLVVVAGFDLLWQVLMIQAKSLAVREVQDNAGLALRRMAVEIRGASDVARGAGGESVFGQHPGKLTLKRSGTGTGVVIDTVKKVITVGGSAVTIRVLRITVGGASPDELTSPEVDVASLVFRDLTPGAAPDSIQVELTVQAVNPSNLPERRAQLTLVSSLTLRH